MSIIIARYSSVVLIGRSIPLSADFSSNVIDFRDSSHAGVQIIWRGVDSIDGAAILHGSLLADPGTLDDNDVEDSSYIIEKVEGSHLYTYKKLSFRYAQIRWVAGTVTTGEMDIYAQGKRD